MVAIIKLYDVISKIRGRPNKKNNIKKNKRSTGSDKRSKKIKKSILFAIDRAVCALVHAVVIFIRQLVVGGREGAWVIVLYPILPADLLSVARQRR